MARDPFTRNKAGYDLRDVEVPSPDSFESEEEVGRPSPRPATPVRDWFADRAAEFRQPITTEGVLGSLEALPGAGVATRGAQGLRGLSAVPKVADVASRGSRFVQEATQAASTASKARKAVGVAAGTTISTLAYPVLGSYADDGAMPKGPPAPKKSVPPVVDTSPAALPDGVKQSSVDGIYEGKGAFGERSFSDNAYDQGLRGMRPKYYVPSSLPADTKPSTSGTLSAGEMQLEQGLNLGEDATYDRAARTVAARKEAAGTLRRAGQQAADAQTAMMTGRPGTGNANLDQYLLTSELSQSAPGSSVRSLVAQRGAGGGSAALGDDLIRARTADAARAEQARQFDTGEANDFTKQANDLTAKAVEKLDPRDTEGQLLARVQVLRRLGDTNLTSDLGKSLRGELASYLNRRVGNNTTLDSFFRPGDVDASPDFRGSSDLASFANVRPYKKNFVESAVDYIPFLYDSPAFEGTDARGNVFRRSARELNINPELLGVLYSLGDEDRNTSLRDVE